MININYNSNQQFYVVSIGIGEFDENGVATINFVDDGIIKTVFVSRYECDREYKVSPDGSTIIEYYNAFIDTHDIQNAECIDFDTLSTYYDIQNINYDKQNNSSLGFLHIVSIFTCAVLLFGYLAKSIRKITRW